MIASMRRIRAAIIVSMLFTGNAAQASGPEQAAREFQKAKQCQKILDSEGAVQHYNKALELDPKNTRIYVERGIAYKDLGKYDLALKDYNKSLTMAPGNIPALESRARLYDMTGRLKEAIADYDCVLKSPQGNWQTWRHRAICNRRLKNYLESAKDFGTALKLAGVCQDQQQMMYYQAEMLFLGNDLPGALSRFDAIIKRFPDLSGAYWSRAKIYDKLGKADLAEKDRQKARKLDEDFDPLNRL